MADEKKPAPTKMYAVRFPKPGPIPFLNLHGPINRVQRVPAEMYNRLKQAHVAMELVEEMIDDDTQVRVPSPQPTAQETKTPSDPTDERAVNQPAAESDVTKEEDKPQSAPPQNTSRISPAQRRAAQQQKVQEADDNQKTP